MKKRLSGTTFEHDEAILHFARLLKKFKVEELLEESGAKTGDNVYIGDIVFEFQPEKAME